MVTPRAQVCLVLLLAVQAAGTSLAQSRQSAPRTRLGRSTVSAPNPAAKKVAPLRVSFSLWKPLGQTRGKRPIHGVKTGSGDFRVLVVGSLAGNDAPALALVDRLAAEVVQNAAIIGGFRSVIIRSGNPDGVALRRSTNAANVKIATAFPREGSEKSEPEIRFLAQLFRTYKPHRILHVTSGSANAALILHNGFGHDTGQDLADWLSVQTKTTKRFAPRGSMEEFVGESAEVLTLVLPKNAAPKKVWEQYGDSLLASLAPNAPAKDWPPPTAWNREPKGGARVYRSGGTMIKQKSPQAP